MLREIYVPNQDELYSDTLNNRELHRLARKLDFAIDEDHGRFDADITHTYGPENESLDIELNEGNDTYQISLTSEDEKWDDVYSWADRLTE